MAVDPAVKKIFLRACSGRRPLGIPRGHLYHVVIDGKETEEFLTRDEALEKYPSAKISASDSLCHWCYEELRSEM